MPQSLAICLEDLNTRDPAARYLRCVALSGAEPGLTLAPDGAARWQSPGPCACELWISQDERLILLRPPGAVPVQVLRAGRALTVPEGKPVVLRDQDGIAFGHTSLRVHVHGLAGAIHAPAFLEPAPAARPPSPLRTAAAVVMAAAVGAAGCDVLQVRAMPPKPAPPGDDLPEEDVPPEGDAPPVPEVGEGVVPAPPPIDVRDEPPRMAPEPPPIEVLPAPPAIAAPLPPEPLPPPPQPPPVVVPPDPVIPEASEVTPVPPPIEVRDHPPSPPLPPPPPPPDEDDD